MDSVQIKLALLFIQDRVDTIRLFPGLFVDVLLLGAKAGSLEALFALASDGLFLSLHKPGGLSPLFVLKKGGVSTG